MQENKLEFQKNIHPREYVYEVSNFYLLARAIHLAQSLKLFSQTLATESLDVEFLEKNYPNFDPPGLTTLIKYLQAYAVFNNTHSKSYDPSVLSQLDFWQGQEWQNSYSILEFLGSHSVESFYQNKINVAVENHTLRLNYDNLNDLILELGNLHLVARSVHYATQLGLFDLLRQNQLCGVDEILTALEKTNEVNIQIVKNGFKNLLFLLDRYQLLHYNSQQGTLTASIYSLYLQKNYPQTIQPAMLIVSEKWWKAAGCLQKSFLKDSLSAFEYANQQNFYQSLESNPQIFGNGMAAISLLEDDDVAESITKTVQEYTTVMDVGGGKGGLLSALHRKMTGQRQYVLFEKDFGDEKLNEEFKTSVYNVLTKNQANMKLDVILGDFFKAETIPTYNDAAYFIKCVLHNMKREEATKILQNVRQALGQDCQLFLAERVVPNNISSPHLNKWGNVLMRMLFKANTYNAAYYESVLNEAGFDLKDVTVANNYLVFFATEKPALRFNKKASMGQLLSSTFLQDNKDIAINNNNHDQVQVLSSSQTFK